MLIAPWDRLAGRATGMLRDRCLPEERPNLVRTLLGAAAGLSGEPLSALGPSSSDGVSAIWGAHAGKKSMSPFPLASVRLVCPLHARSSFSRQGWFHLAEVEKTGSSIAPSTCAVKSQIPATGGQRPEALRPSAWLEIV